jgi:hypothetical protein
MADVDLPPDVEEDLARLGEPQNRYEVRPMYVWRAYLQSGFMLFTGGILGLVCIIWIRHLHFLLFLIPGAMMLSAVRLWRAARRHSGMTILEYPVGIIRLQNGELYPFLWDDIVNVGVEFSTLSFSRDFKLPGYPWWLTDANALVLSKAGGEPFTIHRSLFADVRPLFTSIYSRTLETQWPAMIARIQDGVPAMFGDLAVSAEGLSVSGKPALPWGKTRLRCKINNG